MTPIADEPAAVSLRGVGKAFGPTEVLIDLDLELEPGTVTALLGPSGCGKTTALRVIAGLEPLDGGTVAIGESVVSGPGVHVPTERRRVGMVFQDGALFPHLSVARNVGYGLGRGDRRGGPRIAEMLELVGLSGFGDRSPDSLSGGQRQRVALARALAPAPAVVLMDEPFSNLDAQLRARLRREVAEVVRAAGVTVLLVTHDRDEAFVMADRVAVMREGSIAQTASPRDIYARPADDWIAAFVGEVGGRLQPGGVLLRPEDLEICGLDQPGSTAATVVHDEFAGADVLTTVELDGGRQVVVRSRSKGSVRRRTGESVGVRALPDGTGSNPVDGRL